MPTFRYSAYGTRGEFAKGTIDAVSADAATEILWSQRLSPFELNIETTSHQRWWQREISFVKKNRQFELTFFTREFATLLEAGIPLDDALRILCDQPTSTRISTIAASLRIDVVGGSTLSDAMQKQSDIFPVDYVSVVRAGEIGGTISQEFKELAGLLERRTEIQAKIRSALIYPSLLMGFAIICLGIIIGALVPSIASIFASSKKSIPDIIRIMMWIQKNWPDVLVGITVMILSVACASMIALRQTEIGQVFDRWKLKTPIFGSFIIQRDTARFVRTLGTLLRAGVPLLQASVSAHSVLLNRHIATRIDGVIAAIREGSPLNRALESEIIFPIIAVRMISVGEEAGTLERMLMRLGATLEQQMQHTIDRSMTMLTPILTTVMAALIGGLIMTVMDAILSLNSLAFQ